MPKHDLSKSVINDIIASSVRESSIGIILVKNLKIIYANKYAESLLGFPLDNLYILDVLHAHVGAGILGALLSDSKLVHFEDIFVSVSGDLIFIRGTVIKHFHNDSAIYSIVFSDVTAEKNRRLISGEDEEFTDTIANSIDVGIVTFSIKNLESLELRLHYMNALFSDILDLSGVPSGKKTIKMSDVFILSDDQVKQIKEYIRNSVRQELNQLCMHRVQCIDERLYQLNIKAVTQSIYPKFIAVLIESTQNYCTIDDLMNKSYVDQLTSLLNRRYVDEYIETVNNNPSVLPLSVIMLDIDFFKRINDTYGHDFGDYVLKTVAHIVKNTVRKTDIVCRYGGEEFIIFCEKTPLQGAVTLAEKIRLAVSNYDFENNLKVTCSLGVAEHKGSSLQETIKTADNFLYTAKRSGRNKVIF